ncbi:MAG: cation transporter [Candidatus Aminicenantes bacterium]|nr:cation transporter [Candidatus Aminicenantes bacterium]NIN21399.1 cation transporter [Candidatus Aminicenantes bacterium]NIO84366.1 cation transporter [Candidatus Aminicenantes bacterium]
MKVNKECESCQQRLGLWALIASLFLSLVKGVVGILGSSEALVADGLCSFYQSFVVVNSIFYMRNSEKTPPIYKSIWFAGLVISAMLILGTGDVVIFSVVRIAKAAKGLLVRPSPYALYSAILSVLANQLLYRYSLCLGKEMPETSGWVTDITQSLRFSVIVSCIVVIGIGVARIVSLYGDAIAALIVAAILIPKVVDLLNESWKQQPIGNYTGLQGHKA